MDEKLQKIEAKKLLAQKMINEGSSFGEIARLLNISMSTSRRYALNLVQSDKNEVKNTQ
jgi:predicted transcriptional regulator